VTCLDCDAVEVSLLSHVRGVCAMNVIEVGYYSQGVCAVMR